MCQELLVLIVLLILLPIWLPIVILSILWQWISWPFKIVWHLCRPTGLTYYFSEQSGHAMAESPDGKLVEELGADGGSLSSIDDIESQPRGGWDKWPEIANSNGKVVIMGDSVLDNFFWLKEPKEYLRPVLQRRLEEHKDPDITCAAFPDVALGSMGVINLAVDQMSTFDFIKRTRESNSWYVYSHGRTIVQFENKLDRDYLISQDGNVYSVKNLQKVNNVKYVLVSVGGNDVYLQASIQIALILSLLPFQSFRREKVGKEFGQRLSNILKKIEAAVPDAVVIPVIVYHPHYDFSISGLQHGFLGCIAKTVQKYCLKTMVTSMVRQFMLYARDRHLPVIDLSRTLDPSNVSHYGTEDMKKGNYIDAPWSGAEPSNVSNVFICELVEHVMKNFDPREKSSRVYYAKTKGQAISEIVSERNSGAYPDLYQFFSGPPPCYCPSQ
eukprot:TRINITY_DN5222_c0_g2_i1.p1 TRINITY_DN5222_c0_g2~~TRINITY_DN5222_c0_g2_i1.p1  ORF type:complete len:441 (-),score=100.74 TRINITY_DN5222_c0_g2_i1:1316-2638(-)